MSFEEADRRFHKHQHFEAADGREHERACNGRDVPDYCANCNAPFMSHHNGRCPK